jgi:hypothetical protein
LALLITCGHVGSLGAAFGFAAGAAAQALPSVSRHSISSEGKALRKGIVSSIDTPVCKAQPGKHNRRKSIAACRGFTRLIEPLAQSRVWQCVAMCYFKACLFQIIFERPSCSMPF